MQLEVFKLRSTRSYNLINDISWIVHICV